MRNIGFYLLIIFIAITFIDYFSVKNATTKQEMGYSAFLQQVDKGEVAKVTMMNNVIEGVLTDGTEFVTVTPDAPNDEESPRAAMVDCGIVFGAADPLACRCLVFHHAADPGRRGTHDVFRPQPRAHEQRGQGQGKFR